jgi:tRNA A-37 threonylcarbamoyl transferase component Bud32
MGLTPESAPIERYVVSEYLAEGGMGAIYRGQRLGAGGFAREVVLKQLLPEYTRQPEFIELFLREARLSATLDHANIIHTIDLVTAGDEYFIVMEYLPGADLRTLGKRIKRRRKKLAPAAALYIAREVLSALAYAHAKLGPDGRPLGLIHRDVSPSNILVSQSGEVKLTDFGIAKASTHTSVFYKVKGKVGYMSPEQARSEELDHRSDLYSLAVCLHELVSGERLFVVPGLTTTPEQIYSQPVPTLSSKVPGLPAELDRIMARALAPSPNDRYQSAGAFQEALLRCAHRNGLMMSAPELAAHLRQICGPPEEWRELEDVGRPRSASIAAGGGTEVYDFADDGEGTQQVDPDELDDDDGDDDRGGGADRERDRDRARELSAARARPVREEAWPRASSTIELGRLQGIELTSMIDLANLEQRGHRPLVDWGDGGDADGGDDDDDRGDDDAGARAHGRPHVRDRDGGGGSSVAPRPASPSLPPPALQARQPPALQALQPPALQALQPPALQPLQPPALQALQPPALQAMQPPALQAMQPMHAMAPPPPMAAPPPGLHAQSPALRRRRWLLSGAVAIALVAVAGIAAAVIGMSGPDVDPTLPAAGATLDAAPAAPVDDAAPAALVDDAAPAALVDDTAAPP